MIKKLVYYSVQKNKINEATKAIKIFISSIRKKEPDIEYDIFRLANSNHFIHIMTFPDLQAEDDHRHSVHTLEFVKILYPNCMSTPEFYDLVNLH
jgi:quinol monooxygenase YgiN